MLRWLMVCALSTALLGCAGPEVQEEQSQAGAQVSRELSLTKEWQGRDYQELLAVWGEPQHEMTIPRYGWPDSRAVLFNQDPASGCIDAFLIVRTEERTWVDGYFCR